MALNGIRCVMGYGTGCCPSRATDGGDGGGRCDGVYDEGGNGERMSSCLKLVGKQLEWVGTGYVFGGMMAAAM